MQNLSSFKIEKDLLKLCIDVDNGAYVTYAKLFLI